MLRLLVSLDFGDCSRVALDSAWEVAARAAPAELILLNVSPQMADDAASLAEIENAVDRLRRMVDEVRATRPAPEGVTVRYTAVSGSPAEQIVAQADALCVDAIVVGTHGRRGLDRLVLGSVAEMVVRTAPCSVLTVKTRKNLQ